MISETSKKNKRIVYSFNIFVSIPRSFHCKFLKKKLSLKATYHFFELVSFFFISFANNSGVTFG